MKYFDFITPIALVLTLITTGCSGSEKSSPQQDVSDTVGANKIAAGHLEWESSGLTSEDRFARWQKQNVSAEDVCAALSERTDEELTLFENSINDKNNLNLIEPCKILLKQRLENYWKRERESSEIKSDIEPKVEARPTVHDIRSGFTFPTVVVERDFSKGYFVVNGELKQKQVLLTFDDGPHGEYTDQILAALGKVRANVLFFAMGNNVRANPAALRRVAKAGHGIGSHSMTHRCLAFKQKCAKSNRMSRPLTFAESVADITNGHQAIQNVLGWVDPFFRFPYGESAPELKKFLQKKSTGEFYWSVDSNDWKSQPLSQMIQNTMKQVNQKGRGVLLFHDIHRRTAEALPELLRQLYFGGYTIVTMRASDPNARYNSKLVQRSNVAKTSGEFPASELVAEEIDNSESASTQVH